MLLQTIVINRMTAQLYRNILRITLTIENSIYVRNL